MNEIDSLLSKMLDSEFHPNEVMSVIERNFLKMMMERLGHNQKQVAHVLGINRGTLRTRMRRYRIYDPALLKKPRRRPTVKPHLSTLRT